ncbi:unnamed protein product [Lepeophtheirus salmonis]|uniref:(salmon louse) hypothetical protein n=1 Tax=Lepeophtheirus salmonis TaxID=72036 RepID=A0A7R8CIZ9_LEPSM|nr:unnamed protein product [Lepeophtheirus salmonis]CAF2837049.1 unnamed protein product [Lepeophtheirus salmonis]
MYCCLARFDRHLSVSWIRIKEDVIVLTHGHLVFTTDDRIKVGYDSNGIWSLSISRVGQEDFGKYECQTNTEIKNSVIVSLNVLETSAEIPGPKRILVKEGSTVKLTCKVYLGEKGPDLNYRKNAVVHWFQGQRLLDPLLESRLIMRTEIGVALQGWLEIKNVSLLDTGNYSCVPSYAIPDWTQIHIMHDEKSAVLHEEMSEVKVDTSSQIALSLSNSHSLQYFSYLGTHILLLKYIIHFFC